MVKESDLKLPKKYRRSELNLGEKTYSESPLKDSQVKKMIKGGPFNNIMIIEENSDHSSLKNEDTFDVLKYEEENLDAIRNEMDKIEKRYIMSAEGQRHGNKDEILIPTPDLTRPEESS